MSATPLLVAWLLTDLLATYGVFHHRRAFTPVSPALTGPCTAVLIAIKGVSDITPQFLNALRAQEYRDFRLIFALESGDDPAWPMLAQLQRELSGTLEVDLIVAGLSSNRAQKVHNLLAASNALRAEDRIVVFADADIVPDPLWLARLVLPVASGETAASCGYRWQLPIGRDWPSLIVAAVDMSVATAARSRMWNLCWGGSVALDRAALEQIDLRSTWERAASDDLTLTRALRRRRLRIYVPPRVLVPSPVMHSWSSLFSFMHRQYLLVRTYALRHWLVAAWTLCVPGLGAAVACALTLQRHFWALIVILASALLLQLRLQVRRSIAAMVLPPQDQASASATVKFARWAWPLIHLVHLAAFARSAWGTRVTWAGVRYRLNGRAVAVEGRA
jgi:cellulose synthase/poly-beta-1,6-N-acetylglucosamine synthase-like glycosyltransferase